VVGTVSVAGDLFTRIGLADRIFPAFWSLLFLESA